MQGQPRMALRSARATGRVPMAKPKPPRLKKCPICGRTAQDEARPFCSARCKDVDLHRWLSGSYAIPASADDDDDDDGRSSDG
jgi:uncharacterized protein